MLVDESNPVIMIRFVPAIQEDGMHIQERSYMFSCRAINNHETGAIDIDMVFNNDKEREEYAELEKKRTSGVEYYVEIPDLK